MKLSKNHWIAIMVGTIVSVSAFCYYYFVVGPPKEYPYYEIRQGYKTRVVKGVEYFDVTTNVVKVRKERGMFDYEPREYETNMYGRTIINITFEGVDSVIFSEYGVAEQKISKYKHVDLMINKDYKK
jgi:hypothetical protein